MAKSSCPRGIDQTISDTIDSAFWVVNATKSSPCRGTKYQCRNARSAVNENAKQLKAARSRGERCSVLVRKAAGLANMTGILQAIYTEGK